MKQRTLVIAAFVASLAPAPVYAQSWATLATDVFTTLRWARAGARDTWRDLDLGDLALALGGARSWGDPGAGSTSFVLLAEGQTALVHRTDVSDRLHGAAFAIRQLDNDGAALWAGADVIGLPSATARTMTAELSGGVRARLPHWLPSRRPLFIVEGAGDLYRYRTMYVRSALRLDYEVGQGRAAFIEVGQAWSGLPGGEAIGSVPFANQGTDVSIRATLQHADTKSRTWSVEPYIRMIWSTRNADPNLFDPGIRVDLVY